MCACTHAHSVSTCDQFRPREVEKDRKISFEKSAATFSLKLGGGGGGGAQVKKEAEAFISNVPVTDDTPSLLENNDR